MNLTTKSYDESKLMVNIQNLYRRPNHSCSRPRYQNILTISQHSVARSSSYPQDMLAIQELIWQIRPDLIIEAGITHVVLSALMLALLDYCDAVNDGQSIDPMSTHRRVLGIDMRTHNRSAIEVHPMLHRIDIIHGSSIEPEVIAKVHEVVAGYKRTLIILDSNHTHDYILAELEAYAPLTSHHTYCIVFDTVVEDLPPDRPWSRGNSPKTAVLEYWAHLQQKNRLGTAAELQNRRCVGKQTVHHRSPKRLFTACIARCQ